MAEDRNHRPAGPRVSSIAQAQDDVRNDTFAPRLPVNNAPAIQQVTPRKDTNDGDIDSDFAEDWAIICNDIEYADFEKLKKFREALRHADDHDACKRLPLTKDPHTLLRTLRSFDYDVEGAAAWYAKDYLDWRVRIDLDKRLASWRAEFEEGRSRRAALMRDYFAVTELCPDKYGVPIVLFRWGVMDMAGLVREVGPEPIQLQWIHWMERGSNHLTEAARRNRKVIEGQIHIYDTGDYPQQVGDWTSRMWSGGMSMTEVLKSINYPNVMRRLFILRSAFTIRSLYRLSYPVLRATCNPSTLARVSMFGQSATEWEAELREELDPSQVLPDFLVSESEAAFASAEPSGGFVPVGGGAPGLNSCSGGEDVTDEDFFDEDITDDVENTQTNIVGVYKAALSARQDSVLIIKDDNSFWHAHTVTPRVEKDEADSGICVQIVKSFSRCGSSRTSSETEAKPNCWEQLEIVGTYEHAPGGQIILTCEGFRISSGHAPEQDPAHLLLWPLRVQQAALDRLVERRDLRLHYRYLGGGGHQVGFNEELFRIREEIDAGAHIDCQTANMLLAGLGFPKVFTRLSRPSPAPAAPGTPMGSASGSPPRLPSLLEVDDAGSSDADDEFLTPRSQSSLCSSQLEERVRAHIGEWVEQKSLLRRG